MCVCVTMRVIVHALKCDYDVMYSLALSLDMVMGEDVEGILDAVLESTCQIYNKVMPRHDLPYLTLVY